MHEQRHLALVLNIQTDFEGLHGTSVRLCTDIGNVEMKAVDEFENRQQCSHFVAEHKFHQHDMTDADIIIQITEIPQCLLCTDKNVRLSFHFQKQGMGVDSFVVGYTGDIQTEIGNSAARKIKRTDAIRHTGRKCFLHIIYKRHRGPSCMHRQSSLIVNLFTDA